MRSSAVSGRIAGQISANVDYRDGRVNELDFTTRFHRTWFGFGVGSSIPLGPCHRTATASCEHRWHGFVWNAWVGTSPAAAG